MIDWIRCQRRRLAFAALILMMGSVALRLALPRPALWQGIDFSRSISDRDHHLLRLTLTNDEKYRLRVSLSKISPALVEATLFQEDRAFRHHPGVNPLRLAKAAWDTYVRHQRREGGSTITMQLARIRFGIDSHTIPGKIEQIGRALQLEWYYSKDEILEAYLNLAPYGGNVEGAGAASLVYFQRPAANLTPAQAATLAVIPQNPTRRSPEHSGSGLAQARDRLLRAWRPRDPAIGHEIVLHGTEELPFLAPHFAQAVLEEDPVSPEQDTTLDLRMQRLLERQMHAFIEARSREGIRNASAMIVDWRSLEVLASVGSANFFDSSIDGQVNGTRAKRSPGSALKPFVYGLGFDQGLIHPMSMLKDAPARFAGYNPENFDGDFLGPVPAKEALVKSRNVPALLVEAGLHPPTLYDLLQRAHVTRLRPESEYGLSIALGSAETSMEELVSLYAMLANGGVWRPLRARLSDPRDEGQRLLSAQASFLVLDALRDHGRPGRDFENEDTRDQVPLAWKTGTSWGFRDAWCLAVFGPWVLAVWVGNFDGKSNRAFVGLEAAAPLLFDIADALRAEHPEVRQVSFPPPQGVSRVRVCAVSGDLPGPFCKHTVSTWFIPGKSPIKTCDVHREVLVDTQTKRLACSPGPHVRGEVYEFWPSDLARLFRLAGLPRRSPPPSAERCALQAGAAAGNPPRITSPEVGLTYSVPMRALGTQTVPLSAVADADAHELFWFLDDSLVARGSAKEQLFWKAKPGSYVLRVVDDQGRSDSRTFTVALVE